MSLPTQILRFLPGAVEIPYIPGKTTQEQLEVIIRKGFDKSCEHAIQAARRVIDAHLNGRAR